MPAGFLRRSEMEKTLKYLNLIAGAGKAAKLFEMLRLAAAFLAVAAALCGAVEILISLKAVKK